VYLNRLDYPSTSTSWWRKGLGGFLFLVILSKHHFQIIFLQRWLLSFSFAKPFLFLHFLKIRKQRVFSSLVKKIFQDNKHLLNANKNRVWHLKKILVQNLMLRSLWPTGLRYRVSLQPREIWPQSSQVSAWCALCTLCGKLTGKVATMLCASMFPCPLQKLLILGLKEMLCVSVHSIELLLALCGQAWIS
jgi:hypothetical protein